MMYNKKTIGGMKPPTFREITIEKAMEENILTSFNKQDNSSVMTFAVRFNGNTDDNGHMLFVRTDGRQHCPNCSKGHRDKPHHIKEISYSTAKNTLVERGTCNSIGLSPTTSWLVGREPGCNRRLRKFRKSLLVRRIPIDDTIVWRKSTHLRNAFKGTPRYFQRALIIPSEFRYDQQGLEYVYQKLDSRVFNARSDDMKQAIEDGKRVSENITDNYMNSIRRNVGGSQQQMGQQPFPNWTLEQQQMGQQPFLRQYGLSSPSYPELRNIDCPNCGTNPSVFQQVDNPESRHFRCNTCNHHIQIESRRDSGYEQAPFSPGSVEEHSR